MQEQMSKTQAELEKQTIEVSAGGGKAYRDCNNDEILMTNDELMTKPK